MDYLRDSIVTFFTGLDVEKVIKSWCDKEYGIIYTFDEIEIAHKLYEKNIRNASLDQMYIISQTIYTLWMNSRSEEFHILFSKSPTIFNIILHFSAEVLSMTGNGDVRCTLPNVLRWHELTTKTGEDWLVTSYIAASNLYNQAPPPSFDWSPILNVDFPQLNDLLDNNQMVDLHNHLLGSSLNFDLNWLSLMNYAHKINWDDVSKKISNKNHLNKIRSLSYKAACIRLYLWSLYSKKINVKEENIKDVLSKNDYSMAQMSATNMLNNFINQARLVAYKFYYHDKKYKVNYSLNPVVVDYAITQTCVTSSKQNNPNYIYSVLSGERCLMYYIYRDIYNNKSGIESTATLFFAYMLIKNQIRKELVQVNDGVGFSNFSEYERCKKLFIYENSEYSKLVEQLAISSTLAHNPTKRYMETRIAPNDNTSVSVHINSIVKNVSNPLFADTESIDTWQYDFVYHFIKTKSTLTERFSNIHCRNYLCRKEVRDSSVKIAKYIQQKVPGKKRVVGIDAANSEMNCRPEVFAQAYRYLRATPIYEYDYTLKMTESFSLGFTYHVGEDNYDIVDGIRSVDEVIRFLEYQPGDRLGHCIVLGIDVNKYYRRRHYTLMMPCSVLLDNIVWLLHEIDRFNCGSFALKQFLKEKYEVLFRKIYNEVDIPFLTTYYASWLLRGDNPDLYINSTRQKKYASADLWNRFAKTKGIEYILARANYSARRLNRLYHFDGNVKKNGSVSEVLKLPHSIQKDWIDAVCCLQKNYLKMIDNRQFCIECNPTSNVKIGGFEKYVEHPLFIFNHFEKTSTTGHKINISINTDDKGVFATSLEREYALLALALKKNNNDITWNKILTWLDDVRYNGITQAFHFPLTKIIKEYHTHNISDNSTSFIKRMFVYLKNRIKIMGSHHKI